MAWLLHLEAGLSVEREATRLGPPPNATVAVLLVLLASRYGADFSRAELAVTLYPDASRHEALNALRQSLFRLRRWLGEECLEGDGARIGLAAGRWRIVPDVLSGERLGAALLPGVEHPGLDRIRREWSPSARSSLDVTAQAFLTVVKGLAEHDLDAARGVFVAGGPLLGQLGNDHMAELLRRTKPLSRNAPYALEHRERAALFLTQLAEFEQAKEAFAGVYRQASRNGNDAVRMRAAAYVACNAIELGEMAEAEVWLGQLEQGRSGMNLDLLNSQACFYWNAGDTARALALMDEARRHLAGADGASRFRYWVNNAFLSVEAGELDRSAEAVAQASELGEPAGSPPNSNLEIVRALGWAGRGEPYYAIDRLSKLLDQTRSSGYRVDTLYVEEALTGVHASVGNTREARQLWASARGTRGGRQNPRIAAQRQRVTG